MHVIVDKQITTFSINKKKKIDNRDTSYRHS